MNGDCIKEFLDVEPTVKRDIDNKIEQFLRLNSGRQVALVTSGGTTVPLERNTVRYLENFSQGTRGARSAEEFLAHDYAVVYFHRVGCLIPYQQRIETKYLMDLLKESRDGLSVDCNDEMVDAVRKWNDVTKGSGRLMLMEFKTVSEYLSKLICISTKLSRLDNSLVLYLAAAVSDFYIPSKQITEHKIQSNSGNSLELKMIAVPKLLAYLIPNIVPKAFTVTFKLETDNNILLEKCNKALDRYGHQLVVGNILDRRKFEIVLIDQERSVSWIKLSDQQMADNVYIEKPLIAHISAQHQKFCCS